MEDKKTAVFGIYNGRTEAESAVTRIMAAGFSEDDISVLLASPQSTRDFAHKKDTKAPEGTTTGGVIGGVLGGALGLLVSIGTLSIAGLGSFIAAGPIMATLAGLGVGGTAGGIIGALVGMGIPEYEAKRYEGRVVKEGGVLLSVHCDTSEEVSRAKDLLEQTGAQDISSEGEASTDAEAARIESDKPLRPGAP